MDSVRLSFTLSMCFLAVLAFPACSDDTTPQQDSGLCAADDECTPGWYCENGTCQKADITCDDTHPCPDGYECRNGGCALVPTDGGIDGDGGDGGDGGEPEPGPDIEIIEPPAPEHQLNFGNVMVGVTVSRQVKLANVGDADLVIMQLNFESCLGIDDFSVPPDQLASLPVTVPPGEDTVFDVSYTASDGLTDHCILDIVSNDPDEALVKIHMLSEFKGNALASVQPQSLNFGDIPVAETSQPLGFTVSNQGTGNAVLEVEEIRFGILSNPDFTMTIKDSSGQVAAVPALLNNGDFLDVEVVYHPQAEEQDSDEVVITTDDPINPTLRVSLAGNGVVGILDIDPSPVDVGRVRVGEHGETVVTITNTGGAPTALAEVYLWDAGPELFLTSPDMDLADLPNNPHQIGPAESVRVVVNFDPIDIGIEEASLIVENTTEDWYRVISVVAEGYIPAAVETDPDPPTLMFGNVQFDTNAGIAEEKSLIVTIRNVGQESLQISNIQRATMTSQEFTFDPTSIPPIGVGSEAQLSVSFEPANQGSKMGGVLVDTNDPDIDLDGVTGRFRIDVQANGIDPNIYTDPASGLNFGEIYVGMPMERDIKIRNVGTGPLEIQSIELTPGSSSSFVLLNRPGLPLVISNPMTEVVFQVRYLPESLGTDSGAIQIDNSDIGNPEIILNLLGTGSGCPPNTIDCDGDSSNGCETPCIYYGAEACNQRDDDCDCRTDEDFNLNTDVHNCGSCGNDCTGDFPHAVAGCSGGNCFLLHCDAGYDDCDNWQDNGCETHTDSDIANCGSCDNRCSYDNAEALCLGGTCVMGDCDVGWEDCNHLDTDGCEANLSTDPDNCGGCGTRCIYANGVGVCQGGFCHLQSCLPGYDNCDNDESTGCEINLNTDVNNCGSCNHVCSGGSATYICNSGQCEITQCASGTGDCDGEIFNGCETNIEDGEPDHCGACNQACSDSACPCPAPNPPSPSCCHVATYDCVNRSCVIVDCDAGWENCDLQVPNGCETDITSDVNHCGDCDQPCSATACVCPSPDPPSPSCCHVSSWSCVAASCNILSCQTNYQDLDGQILTGCECYTDTVADVCDDDIITELGPLTSGDPKELTGTLYPSGDSDWYTFTANDDNDVDVTNSYDNYNVHIAFDTGGNPDGVFVFDVYRNDEKSTSATCFEKGDRLCERAETAYDHDSGQDPCRGSGMTSYEGPPECEDDSSRYWLRVYRSGTLVNCSEYRINILFTQ
jgi:hypothetical protein